MKKIVRRCAVTLLTALLVIMQMPVTAFAAITVDFASNRTVTYSGIEKRDNGEPYYPLFMGENVVDGKSNTRWSAEQLDIQWLIVDLEETREIDELEIRFFREPLDYTIEVSEDGVTYETLLEVSDNSIINVENIRSFSFATTKTMQYIKINQTKMFVNSGNNKLYGASITEILAYGELDTSGLEFSIEEAEKIIDLENYTEATKNEFLSALANAKDTLDTATTQEEIDEAKNRLLDALGNLKTNYDISELEMEVNSPLLEEGYTAESYSAYKQALLEGEKLLENGNATQKEIDEMVAKIRSTKRGLIEKFKLEELEQLIKEIEGLNSSDYTTDSWKQLQDQLAVAKDALLNATTQQELQAALDALQIANKQLVATSKITGTKESDTNSINVKVDTSDSTNIKVIAIMFVVSVAILICLKEKKKYNK